MKIKIRVKELKHGDKFQMFTYDYRVMNISATEVIFKGPGTAKNKLTMRKNSMRFVYRILPDTVVEIQNIIRDKTPVYNSFTSWRGTELKVS